MPLVVEQSLTITLPRRARRGMTVKVIYQNPIPAPVVQGTPIGRVIVSVPGRKDMELPVVAGSTVERLGLFGRLDAAINFLLWGKSES